MEKFIHEWSCLNSRWIRVPGRVVCLVRIVPDPQGLFLWQVGNQAGLCRTVEGAMDVAETAREIWPKQIAVHL